MIKPSLHEFQISPETGFMIQHCQVELSDKYAAWKMAISDLSKHVENGTVSTMVEKLPLIVPGNIDDELNFSQIHQFKALSLLLHISTAFALEKSIEKGENHPIKVPTSLASPILKLTHPDDHDVLSAQNMDLVYKLDISEDYRWFFVVAMEVEVKAALAIRSIYEYVSNKDDNLDEVLRRIALSLERMKNTLLKMDEKCDPNIYYNNLRDFLAFPKRGIILGEDYNSEPIKLCGASAAQSSAVPLLDTFLQIQHDPSVAAFLNTMKSYMLPMHVEFIDYVRSHSDLRGHLKKKNDPYTTVLYNRCIDQLIEFRTNHWKLVVNFVVKPSGEKDASELKGTATSSLENFLTNLIKSTTNAKMTP
ncbi:hypothetical protein ACOME3_008658 [Neoechinorhynchus agilis]